MIQRIARLANPIVIIFILVALPAANARAQSDADDNTSLVTTYTNPTQAWIADPFVIREGETYYMYGTGESPAGPGFDYYTSPDLVTWTRGGNCFTRTDDTWGSRNFWAPEVIKHDGSYYLHYTVYNPRENRRNICIAKSDSPTGPFRDHAGPLFPDRSVIDSHIYHDPDSGKFYLYASPEHERPSKILGAELSPDFTTLLSSPTTCLESEFGWEDLWIEAPIIHKHNGVLYMLYSGGAWWEPEYQVGYATATSPLGPWTKFDGNPVLRNTDSVEGPGHNGLAWSPDGSELFIVYHTHGGDHTTHRVVALDRIVFQRNGDAPDLLTIPTGATSTPQLIPSGARPRLVAASDDFRSDTLNTGVWQVMNNHSDGWTIADGALRITAHNGDLWRSHISGRNVFLQHAPSGDFDIETSVTMNIHDYNEQAFLVLWDDRDNYVSLAVKEMEGPTFDINIERRGKASNRRAPNPFGNELCLRIQKRGNTVKFQASADGKTWHPAGRDVKLANPNPRYIGLGAWSPGSSRQATAQFDWFRVIRR